ncbi:aldo/keto reductase [Neorhodopirellula lusitana]|uniref:aldo/keto reductase n=1 Tax=Neorhodopirellula lusitana TaxID=445327 RepID=UPI00384A9EF5
MNNQHTNGSAGTSDSLDCPVVLGLWPIAGVTTMGVTSEDALQTIRAAIELGITTFDSAYGYGLNGESDRYLGQVLSELGGADQRDADRFHVIGKVGQRYVDGTRVIDGRAETLRQDAEESLRRLRRERFGTLMLHSIDENVPVEESAAALLAIREAGLAERIGLCNATPDERQRFDAVCRCEAIQCPLNFLQREHLAGVIADADANDCDVWIYWTLMKGLLAGKIGRDHVFAEGDSRPGYAIFQGEARQRAHDVVDGFVEIAGDLNMTVVALSVSWAISQPGVTAALAGARRPEQIQEVVGARRLDADVLQRMETLRVSC